MLAVADDPRFAAAHAGDVEGLRTLLGATTDAEVRDARIAPYGWTLLHAAAHGGHLGAVDLLLARGCDPNVREDGDRTYAMHWAAAAGHLPVVQRLADAGGDVVGSGDDHELEVIGWATCWDGGDDTAHRAIADVLIDRGARHHVFSAVALGLEEELRRLAADVPMALQRRQSAHEARQTALHFAVRRNRPRTVALLLELGLDPRAPDADGYPASAYASTPDADRPLAETLRARGALDLPGALALREWDVAARLLTERRATHATPDLRAGALHLMAKRGDTEAMSWLLDQGADPNARWHHWNAEVTPLHLAALFGHAEAAGVLLDAGADPVARDSKHDGDAAGWAEHGGHPQLAQLLVQRAAGE